MVYSSRGLHILACLLLAGAGVFAYDALMHALWANAAIGVMLFIALLAYLFATSGPAFKLTSSDTQRSPIDSNLRVILDQVPIPLIQYNEDNGPIALNRAAREVFGTDDKIALHRDELSDILSFAPGVRPRLTAMGRSYSVSMSELVNTEGHSILAALTDVQTEVNQAEAAALRDTLQILSHEIMNSLTPVASLADIARSYLIDDKPDIALATESLEMLARRAKSLTLFIEAYRSVARLPEPVLRPADPKTFVEDIFLLFQRSPSMSGIDFQFRTEGPIPRLNLDETQLGQALINVLTNAVEATETLTGPRQVVMELAQVHQNVVIRISDNGGGIADSVKPNLFSGFMSTKSKGTGTGLNLARQIALAHGANLRLEEEDGQMTTFTFSFPVPFQGAPFLESTQT
ncbi:sensor histidine kinase [Asticcacaulis sp. 201]|uniref:sensor histidine kinase n=1 Tax=Asticcacaulis sp. 201 TaxID=3028787 RepID=UPI002916F64C|nr:ATP-binding protein [Asticcacaulis sp. 201]MDV6332931.1 ATP-binding protein [Asticcacaulis sp. 201]